MRRVAVAGVIAALVVIGSGGSAVSAQDGPAPGVATDSLTIGHRPAEELAAPQVIDELEPETVLTVHALGFERNTTGSIQQCLSGSQRRCENRLAVRFDDRGSAMFQYLITNRFSLATEDLEPCRLGGDRCTIELRAGDKLSIIDTVFIDEAPPPGRVDVSPRDRLSVGDTVTVTASGLAPGADLTVMVCATPSTRGSRCGAPGPVVPLTIGSDGTAETQLSLDVAKVGADGVACGRRVGCRIVVASDDVGIRANHVNLSFLDAPGADYVTTRLVIGLAAALGLALAAVWLVRTTDWQPPPEADSTAIDEAEFADLDAEAAEFDEAAPAVSN